VVRTIRARFSKGVFEPLALQQFLTSLSILPIDDEVCRIFGRERGRHRQQGRTIGDFDLLIAATCLRHQLEICTNRRHLEAVEGLSIVGHLTSIRSGAQSYHHHPTSGSDLDCGEQGTRAAKATSSP
jgi:PIN domain